MQLGVIADIISILKSANVQKDEVAVKQSPNAAGSDSDGDSDPQRRKFFEWLDWAALR